MIRNQMKNEKNKNKLKMKMKMKIENLERETYGDLVERDLRLEVDVISGSRERAFHCYYSLIPKHAPYHTTSSIWWITEILSLNFSFNSQSFLFSFYVSILFVLAVPSKFSNIIPRDWGTGRPRGWAQTTLIVTVNHGNASPICSSALYTMRIIIWCANRHRGVFFFFRWTWVKCQFCILNLFSLVLRGKA